MLWPTLTGTPRLPVNRNLGGAPSTADGMTTPAPAPGWTASVGASVSLAWILFDFGARSAGVQAARWQAVAMLAACRTRFRPIMMSTMAALLGTLPIALGIGAGAQSRRPPGIAVVGGLLFSQMLTLYITPVFFIGSSAGGAGARTIRWRAPDRREAHAHA